MGRQMFLNLPVKDLDRSVDFFTRLGFTFDPHFTDEKATRMIVGPEVSVMLLVEEFFATFTLTPVADASASTEVIVAVSAEDREDVDRLVDTALAHGAGRARDTEDHGFMYGRSFVDPDGHLWEVVWMSAEAAAQGPP
ncbi:MULTISPECIES: VOC family protein [unclassified Nocardiopsis]|uniref:VOC family protein n=1 Tax=unclassified Nocardiopsis TaxID=2649073 RepID=UPI0033E263D0